MFVRPGVWEELQRLYLSISTRTNQIALYILDDRKSLKKEIDRLRQCVAVLAHWAGNRLLLEN